MYNFLLYYYMAHHVFGDKTVSGDPSSPQGTVLQHCRNLGRLNFRKSMARRKPQRNQPAAAGSTPEN